MNYEQRQLERKIRVGILTLVALTLIGATTIVVNSRPYWWKPCQLVHIDVQDATELLEKAPVQAMGIQVGHLRSVELHEQAVRLGVCITSPVEVLPQTRAFVREKGLLGSKFVEIKPVRYVGNSETKVN